eukprot:3053484-Amphidinium_carterae.1
MLALVCRLCQSEPWLTVLDARLVKVLARIALKVARERGWAENYDTGRRAFADIARSVKGCPAALSVLHIRCLTVIVLMSEVGY